MIQLFLSLIAVLGFHSGSATAGEGGHVGNGGGVIKCEGKAPVILDYYEATQEYHDLIDVEKLSRDEFFSFMIKRLKLGDAQKVPNFVEDLLGKGYSGPNIFHYHHDLEKAVATQPDLIHWATTAPWKIKDEFIQENLPDGCTFEQAAISLFQKDTVYRIPSVTDGLSPGQIHVLELHEYLNQNNYAGTSLSVRQLIQILLKKKLSYQEIRPALYRFWDPFRNYTWKNLGLKVIDPAHSKGSSDIYEGDRYFFNIGVYALLEKKPGCAEWMAIAPLASGSSILQLFQDKTSENEDIILPQARMDLLKKSIVAEWKENHYRRGILHDENTTDWDLELAWEDHTTTLNRKGFSECKYVALDRAFPLLNKPFRSIAEMEASHETELFPRTAFMVDEEFQTYSFVKRLRSYYEERRLGLESQYESQMQTYRDYMKW